MGGTQGKLKHLHLLKNKKNKYRCGECRIIFKKKELSYCATCCEKFPDASSEAFIVCSRCAEMHPHAHLLLQKIPSKKRNRNLIGRAAEDLHYLEGDIQSALADLRNTIWKVEKAHKDRSLSIRNQLEEAHDEFESSGGRLGNKRRCELLKATDEARVRGRLLVSRIKMINESAQHAFASSGGYLNDGGESARDSLRFEIVRLQRLGQYTSMMETISDLLDATCGRVSLCELQQISMVTIERLEHIDSSRQKLADNGFRMACNGTKSSPSEQDSLIQSMMSTISCDFRAECAELLDILTRIHTHADVGVTGYEFKETSEDQKATAIDYLLALNYDDFQPGKKRLNTQRLYDTKVVLIRYLLAIHVCAVWMSVSETDREEKSDVCQQLKDCIDGYVYTAKRLGFPSGHPIYQTLAEELEKLAQKYVCVGAIKAVQRRVEKILSSTMSETHESECQERQPLLENLQLRSAT